VEKDPFANKDVIIKMLPNHWI